MVHAWPSVPGRLDSGQTYRRRNVKLDTHGLKPHVLKYPMRLVYDLQKGVLTCKLPPIYVGPLFGPDP